MNDVEIVSKRTALRLEKGDRVSVIPHGNGYADPARLHEPRAQMATVVEKTQVQHDAQGHETREMRWAIGTDQGEINCRSSQIFWVADNEEHDMTVTVKKGAGRPAAAARTSKAAQRTPLPPKGSKSTPADVEQTTRSRRKAVTGSEESPAPRRGRRSATPIHDESAAKAQPRRTASKATKAASVPANFPGSAKAQAFVDHAAGNGWTSKLVETDGGELLKVAVERGDETIVATWVNGTVTPANLPTYTVAGQRTVKLRNVSAARKLIDGTRVDVKKTPDRGAGKPRAARPGGAKRSRKGQVADSDQSSDKLPFDPAADDDATIVSALRGHVIQWKNRISEAAEQAAVSASGPVRIDRNPAGERAVTFNDPRGGTRSVNLKYLLNVR